MSHDLFRHLLSTLAYRTAVAIKDAPNQYPDFEPGHETRKPRDVLHHMSALLDYVIRCYTGGEREEVHLGTWEDEVARFYALLEQLDGVLAEGNPPKQRTMEQLLQGPLADAMTHVGQLTMCRRLVGSPIPYENYMNADIRPGQIRYI